MYANMYKQIFLEFSHFKIFFCSLSTNIKFSIISIPSSLMMMMWLDDQLEECCPSLTSQMMMSHTIEELNCLWRPNKNKNVVNHIINYLSHWY